ncbi:MAG TPA: tyrosine protein kinase, partial [Burkholderiaceae bacterium]|nr:tyrosine protein kinase [Burkholderiaceae bacterium]
MNDAAAPLHASGADRLDGASDGRSRMPVPIGRLLARRRALTDEQIDRVLDHQRAHGTRFGESAVALRVATRSQVAAALAEQFDYATLEDGDDRPWAAALPVAAQPAGAVAESFRSLRSTLLPAGPRQRILAVVSAEHGDGRSFVAANLAVAF